VARPAPRRREAEQKFFGSFFQKRTAFLKTQILPASDQGIAQAAALLGSGELVAFGTETVYGLGADARNAAALAQVFAAKGRPKFNPLICHYENAEAAFEDVEVYDLAVRLAERFWPGPLTMVLPRRAACAVPLLAGAGLGSLAVRVPAHPVAQKLLAALGGPIAAPSANRSGSISPTKAAHVLAGLEGRIAAVIDSGPCRIGVESTVIDLSGPAPFLLRPGGVGLEVLEACIGPVQQGNPIRLGEALPSPGMMASHYAPNLAVRVNAVSVAVDEGLLAFGPALPGAGVVFQLSEAKDLGEAAARLFEGLHWLDAQRGLKRIAAMPVPHSGLGLAINDRLARAAAPRG
jgi:L-threonylcarbamoyladenylate synthase